MLQSSVFCIIAVISQWQISRLKDAVKHKCGAEMTVQGPFIQLSDRKKAGWDNTVWMQHL